MAENIAKATPEDLGQLWEQTKDVWNHGLLGVDIGSIITAVAIFACFMLIRGIFSKYVLYKLHQWTEKSSTKIDDKIVDALIPPVKFIPVILGVFFAAQYLNLDETADLFYSRVLRSMIAFTMFWAIHRACGPLSHGLKRLERILTPMMMQWLFRALKVLVVFIGAAVILEVWGIAIGPLLAGLGLFGAAVALGAQDLFKNLIGGLTIIAEKRFHPGEWICVDGVVEGVVEDIGFRSTKVRRFDKAPVHVPNTNLADAVVTNFGRMTNRRIFWKIGVTYGTTAEQLKDIREGIYTHLLENEDIAQPPNLPLFVNIDSFNASSIDIMVYCFTKTTDWGEYLQVKEDFAYTVKQIVEGAGSSFAFPSQSLYLEEVSDDIAQAFAPPSKTAPKVTKA